MSIRVIAVALVLSVLWIPSQAVAHEGNPNYRSEVNEIVPEVEGIEIEVLDHDDSLRLRNVSEEPIVVVGYEREPYVRLDPDGTVSVNVRSPAHYLNDDRFAEVELPEDVDPEAPPEWEEVNETSQYAWHDHRIHYMSRDMPSQVTDESKRTRVFDYSVPLIVGGVPGEIRGTLWWVGSQSAIDPIAIGALVLVAIAALAAALIVRRRRDRPDGLYRPDGLDRPGRSDQAEDPEGEAW